jgi:hypothetical protein
MLNVHKKLSLQLQCIGVIVNYIKISFCLKCMGRTNTYHGMNCYIFLIEKKMWYKRFRPIVLGLHDHFFTYLTNNYDTNFHHS